LAIALGLPRRSAVALWLIGRVAGQVAHVLEQRAQGFMLRPRARYLPAHAATGECGHALTGGRIIL